MEKQHINNSAQRFKDPVCGMDVAVGKNSITSTWNKTEYYFCALHCQQAFEKSPEKYLKNRSFFLKRWWDNYLKRLNKASSGKPGCCS